jgi:hypothetical protein
MLFKNLIQMLQQMIDRDEVFPETEIRVGTATLSGEPKLLRHVSGMVYLSFDVTQPGEEKDVRSAVEWRRDAAEAIEFLKLALSDDQPRGQRGQHGLLLSAGNHLMRAMLGFAK